MTVTQDYSGVPVLLRSRIQAPGGALDLVGAALESGVRCVDLRARALPEGFLDLSTGVAGPIAQECVNSGVGRAVLGDPSAAAARSASLCDGMREDSRGRHVWLPMDPSELSERLASRGVG